MLCGTIHVLWLSEDQGNFLNTDVLTYELCPLLKPHLLPLQLLVAGGGSTT